MRRFPKLRKGKTYEVACPDGTTRTLYRHVDDAAPMYIKTDERKYTGGVSDLSGVGANVAAETKQQIEGLLFQISNHNEDIMIQFRAAYVLFQAHPCGAYENFERTVNDLHRRYENQYNARLMMDALIHIAASRPEDSDAIWGLFERIVKLLESPNARAAARDAIADARVNVQSWIEPANPKEAT